MNEVNWLVVNLQNRGRPLRNNVLISGENKEEEKNSSTLQTGLNLDHLHSKSVIITWQRNLLLIEIINIST